MVSKTKLGIKPFDDQFGGTYQSRVTLMSGPAKTGKTAMALQFLNAGLELGEHVLILSAMPSRDLAILAESLDVSVDLHVESGALTILEYNDFVPGRDDEENIMLPPEGFSQLQSVIENSGITRLAIDTIVPWISFPGNRHLAEHIFSFVRAFERLGATTLFTAPKPASPAAQRMLKYLVDNVPVAIYLAKSTDGSELQWRTSKYLGEPSVDCAFKYRVEKNVGIVPVAASEPSDRESREDPEPVRSERPDRVRSPFSQGLQKSGGGQPKSNARNANDKGGHDFRRSPSAEPHRSGGKSAFSSVVWKNG